MSPTSYQTAPPRIKEGAYYLCYSQMASPKKSSLNQAPKALTQTA